MTFTITKKDLVDLVNGKALPELMDSHCRGVEYDSREVKAGNLFIALPGEASHGENFLDEAFKHGALFAVVESRELLENSPHRENLIRVGSALDAFWKIASWWRKKTGVPTAAITGSVGKTTTKEILASILSVVGNGNYALKSFNNHVGVPYTICRTVKEDNWAIIEIGTNHPGEIEPLSKITRPDVAIVTEVAPAHIGAFKTLDDIAVEKLSIANGLVDDGVLILNGDNEFILKRSFELQLDAKYRVLYYGTGGEKLSGTLISAEQEGEFLKCIVEIGSQTLSFALKSLGIHTAKNALAALLAAKGLFPFMTTEELIKGIETFSPPPMRLNVKVMPDKRKVLDDSYNANPSSMNAFLEVAKGFKANGKKVGFIVGDMKELGDLSEKFHAELGQALSEMNPEFVAAVGEYAPVILKPLTDRKITSINALNPEEAATWALSKEFDIVCVKGSRGVALDRAVKRLLS